MAKSDTKLLALVFQHVREIAALQTSTTENDRFRIITPFPPSFNEFPDFVKDDLDFSDPEEDAATAQKDTWNAYEFFTATDGLFYNYDYGLRSPEQSLSRVWKKFTRDAVFTDTAGPDFIESFKEKKNERFARSTIGDLGRVDFYFTSPSTLQWKADRILLSELDCRRLKEKALLVYSTLGSNNSDYLGTLTSELKTTDYLKIEYDLGFFDIIRAWMDPELFDSKHWRFKSDTEALYSENDPDFASGNIRLCFAQRFYIIKNYSGTSVPSADAAPPVTGIVIRTDHRTRFRNNQVRKKLKQAETLRVTSGGREGYVWVNDHWERRKASKPIEPELLPPVAIDSIYKTAAVMCRVIPWKPASGIV